MCLKLVSLFASSADRCHHLPTRMYHKTPMTFPPVELKRVIKIYVPSIIKKMNGDHWLLSSNKYI